MLYSINTAATKNPKLLQEASKVFGSQCIVSSIEAKKVNTKKWEAYIDNGREKTNLDVIKWVKQVQDLGVGEILLTSVDKDGTESGLDEELIDEVSNRTNVSLIVSGGIGKPEHFQNCIKNFKVDGAAAGSIFHYNKFSIDQIKKNLLNDKNIIIRTIKITSSKKNGLEKKYDVSDYNKYSFNQMRDNKLKVKDIGIIKALDKTKKDFDVGVINYGINNLQSVNKALEKISIRSSWVDTSEQIMQSKALVLPGIGAFEHGMRGLRAKKLIDAIKFKASEGTPLLGICLGMQLLFSESEEHGSFKGLNLLPGVVTKLKNDKTNIRIPNIGWRKIKPKNKECENTIIKNADINNDYFYFVHSFFPKPEKEEHVIAISEHGKNKFCCAAKYKNILGYQFHPEKSGQIGLKILKQFFINFVKK